MPSAADDRPPSGTETDSRQSGSGTPDSLQWIQDHRRIAALGGILLALLLAAAVLFLQELFMALWFLLLLFFVHLALRFVRSFERIADAAETLAEHRE